MLTLDLLLKLFLLSSCWSPAPIRLEDGLAPYLSEKYLFSNASVFLLLLLTGKIGLFFI